MKPAAIHRRRGLFWRFYLTGLAVLLLFGLAVGIAARFIEHDPPLGGAGPLIALLADELAAIRGEPGRFKARLDELGKKLGVDIAVYGAGSELRAVSGSAPPPLRPRQVRELKRARWLHAGRTPVLAAPFGPGTPPAEYLVVAWRGRSPMWGLSTILAGLLLVLALVLLPVAHLVARPLERITETARALGRGDLSARTGLHRQDEIGELAGAFDDMAERIEHLIHSEKELLANVSHEFRTPLARIRVALELVEEERGGAEALKRQLGGIGGDLSELERLVEDVLMAARLDLSVSAGEAAALALHKEPVVLKELIAQVSGRFQKRHPERGLRVDLDDDPGETEADPELLRRVFENLLDNAQKYSDPGTAIEIRARAAANSVVVEILDRGIGVAPGDLPRLFDPFFRSDRSRSRVKGGVGLGLTLCRRIVEGHGGAIEAEARDGGGTTFRITLGRS
jgi:signal transduction histidine kinase